VGFHNDHIFRNILNLGAEEIGELKDKRVIGTWDDRPGARPPADWDGSKGTFF
jgi:hypothetical protein